jgi:hypothetical protein
MGFDLVLAVKQKKTFIENLMKLEIPILAKR